MVIDLGKQHELKINNVNLNKLVQMNTTVFPNFKLIKLII